MGFLHAALVAAVFSIRALPAMPTFFLRGAILGIVSLFYGGCLPCCDMQPSLYLHTPEDWGLRTEKIEDMDKLLMLTMVAMPRSDFRSSSSWSSLLLTSRRKHGTSSLTR